MQYLYAGITKLKPSATPLQFLFKNYWEAACLGKIQFVSDLKSGKGDTWETKCFLLSCGGIQN